MSSREGATIARSEVSEAVDRETFAAEVRQSLTASPRTLPSKYLYDELGSALFEAICRLPWYRITSAEAGLLVEAGTALLGSLAPPVSLVELGCGSGDKLAQLAESTGHRATRIELVDISAAALAMAEHRLENAGVRYIRSHHATYEEGLAAAVAHRPADGTVIVLFLGSNLGNYEPAAARVLLTTIRQSLRPGDALILGTDLVKPREVLLRAYDDPLHVTAAFNLNVLRRINDELGGTFDLSGFAHRAVWRDAEQRIEMHLVSQRRQRVSIEAAALDLTFDPRDTIWTESSYKYLPDGVLADGRAAGFGPARQWLDHEAGFALTRFLVARD